MQTSMSPEFMGHIKEKYNREKPEFLGCNSAPCVIIFVNKIDEDVLDYIKANNGRITRNQRHRMEVMINEEIWRIISMEFGHQALCGLRAYKARIDIRIPEDYIRYHILPCMSPYCYEVDFF